MIWLRIGSELDEEKINFNPNIIDCLKITSQSSRDDEISLIRRSD